MMNYADHRLCNARIQMRDELAGYGCEMNYAVRRLTRLEFPFLVKVSVDLHVLISLSSLFKPART
jgi:hypothetical protein